MDLKDFIIQEFNTLVDNLQNSFIEALKIRLLDSDLGCNVPVEKPLEDQNLSLPIKRKDLNRVPRLKKLSKNAEESEEEQYNPDIGLIPEKKDIKPKKTFKATEEDKEENEFKPQSNTKDRSGKSAKEKSERIEKLNDKPIEDKRSENKSHEKLNESVKNDERKEKSGEFKHTTEGLKSKNDEVKTINENISSDTKNLSKKSEQEKDKNDDNKVKIDQKPSDSKPIPKKPEENKGKVVKTSVELKEKSKETGLDVIPLKVPIQIDEKKVEKWNDLYSKIHSPSSNNDLYATLLKFSNEICEKIQEYEIKYIEKSLTIIQHQAKEAKEKQIKNLALSIISRCKEKLPKKPHISDHLQSLGIRLD